MPTPPPGRRLAPLHGFAQDVRLAFRSLHRRPGFAAAAIATLALGIGASTAIFSVAYGVSLRPLPYPDPDRIVRIYEANPAAGKLKEDVSEGSFQGWREGTPSIESFALLGRVRSRVLPGDAGTRITTMGVSPAFFDVLGVQPLLGRTFKPEHQYTRFTAREVVLSYAVWHRMFGGDRAIVGRAIRIDERDDDAFEVVGVMPESFSVVQPVDVWQPTIVTAPVAAIVRNWRYDRVIARLRPGVTTEQARAELEAVAGRLAEQFPASSRGWTVTVETLHASIIGTFGRATWMLLAAVAVVLFVACLNVGGLLVARAISRERETAVRTALGADPWRLLRLWLAEGLVLSVCGLALGVLLAWSGVAALKAAAPPGIPRLDAVALDLVTLSVAALAALLATVVFTVAPLARRHQISAGLRASSGSGDPRSRQTTRVALMGAQCAGAATLVILAVLLARSFTKLTEFDLGWDGDAVVGLSVSPPQLRAAGGRPWYRLVGWSDRLIATLESTPGIESAAITTQIPLSPQPIASTLARGRGKASGDVSRWPGVQHHVTDGYFRMMGIRLVGGRTFEHTDRFAEAQVNWTPKAEKGVAVVSEATARALWPDRSAVGQALWLPDIDNVTWREVVGVVEDIQFQAVGEPPALHVFVPWTQHTSGNSRLLVKAARGGRAPADAATALIPVVRDIVQKVEPGSQVDQVALLDALVARATAQPRFTSRIVGTFGVLALALAAVGIYGTLSYLVGARTREIGIRMALGAPRTSIMSGMLWRGLAPALAGGALGGMIAVALARTFRTLLFEIQPLDPASLVGGGLMLLLVAAAASIGPARRASRIDPADALRRE